MCENRFCRNCKVRKKCRESKKAPCELRQNGRNFCHNEPCIQWRVIPFSPTAESFGVSAQIGSAVVRGGPEARFHEGSAGPVSPGFHPYHGSSRVPQGSKGCRVVRAIKGTAWAKLRQLARACEVLFVWADALTHCLLDRAPEYALPAREPRSCRVVSKARPTWRRGQTLEDLGSHLRKAALTGFKSPVPCARTLRKPAAYCFKRSGQDECGRRD